MAGQSGKRGRFFPGKGRLSRYTPAHFFGGVVPSFPPIPQGMGNTKVPTEEKRWEQCFIFQIAWKFKPQGLSQTARSDGGTTRKTREIFPAVWADFPVMHRRIFAAGRPFLLLNPAGNGKHKSSHRRKKVGVVFCNPDCMKIRTPRAFPNRPERWRDNPEDAKDFSPDEGRLPRYAPAHFCRGTALFFPAIPQGMGNTKAPTEEKRRE